MAADLFRVVRTRVGRNGMLGTIASEPLGRDEAMARFTDCVTLGWDRLRVLNERDYKPSELGPQAYSGEAAKPPADVHYGNRLTPTACGLTEETLPFADGVTLRSSEVTCGRCDEALSAGSTGGSR